MRYFPGIEHPTNGIEGRSAKRCGVGDVHLMLHSCDNHPQAYLVVFCFVDQRM